MVDVVLAPNPVPVVFNLPPINRQTAAISPAGEIRVVPQMFYLPASIDTWRVEVTTAAADSRWAGALYDRFGARILGVDSQSGITVGVKSIALGASFLVPPGLYYFGMSSNNVSLVLRGTLLPNPSIGGFPWRTGQASESATTGATSVVMPSSITPSGIVENTDNQPYSILYDSTE